MIDLQPFNRQLADFKRAPNGEPLYKWFHSSELRHPAFLRGVVQWLRWFDEDRYVLAMWTAPEMPESSWNAQFRDTIPYPRNGMYYPTDILVKPGVDINEQLANHVLGKIKAQSRMKFGDMLAYANGAAEQSERAAESRVSDIINDRATAFGNIPGKRGGTVSFGGVDAATSQTDQSKTS